MVRAKLFGQGGDEKKFVEVCVFRVTKVAVGNDDAVKKEFGDFVRTVHSSRVTSGIIIDLTPLNSWGQGAIEDLEAALVRLVKEANESIDITIINDAYSFS